MKEKYKNLPLRSGVGIVVLNNENKVFVAKRIDNPKNFWQMPQGGVDKDENYYEAALRELKEETNIISVELIKEIDKKFTYILPDHLIGIIWKGKFKGQTQKWFVMRFIGNESEININTKHPEFLDWKWINLDDLPKIAVNFKLDVYKNVKQEVKKIDKNVVRDALNKAEKDTQNKDISDQKKYLLDQKIEVLKSLALN